MLRAIGAAVVTRSRQTRRALCGMTECCQCGVVWISMRAALAVSRWTSMMVGTATTR
jgi:hypothetical protein